MSERIASGPIKIKGHESLSGRQGKITTSSYPLFSCIVEDIFDLSYFHTLFFVNYPVQIKYLLGFWVNLPLNEPVFVPYDIWSEVR